MDGLHFFYFCMFLNEAYSSNLSWQPFQPEILSYVRNRYFSHNSAMWYCIFSLSLSIHAKAEILKCFMDHSCGVVKGNHVRRVNGFLHLTEHTGEIYNRAEEFPSWVHTWPVSWSQEIMWYLMLKGTLDLLRATPLFIHEKRRITPCARILASQEGFCNIIISQDCIRSQFGSSDPWVYWNSSLGPVDYFN